MPAEDGAPEFSAALRAAFSGHLLQRGEEGHAVFFAASSHISA